MPDEAHKDSERIGAAIRAAAATVEAPPRLRARIAEEELREAPGRRRTSRWVLIPALGAAAAVVAMAIGLLTLGRGDAPSVADAAGLALRAPTQPAPRDDSRDERFLRAEIGGIRFPNYDYRTDWATAGARRDEVSGRDALTVVYRKGAETFGYTVVDGDPLEVPAGVRRISAEGLRLAVLRRDGALVVTWRQNGHTCVLAGRTANLDQLIAWANWS
jgi:hypothetical protein